MSKVGLNIGLLLWGAMVSNCGMYISAAAFLPSSFVMYCTMVSYAALLNKRHKVAIFSTAIGALIGWPFSAILGIPIALHVIFYEKKAVMFLVWSLISFVVTTIPSVAIDYYYYGNILLAPLNIVLYNVFGGGGPNLYGTEKFSYYIFNGVLNFNLLFPFAMFGTCVGLVKTLGFLYKYLRSSQRYRSLKQKEIFALEMLMALFLWLLVFMTRPHKEERFLFPVYPLLCFAALFGMETGKDLVIRIYSRRSRNLQDVMSAAIFSTVFVHGILSLSRALALYYGYHAPLDVYPQLSSLTSTKGGIRASDHVNVCVGKEWYRFPSSFFLPHSDWNLRFVKSDFRAQLPKSFEAPPPEGTRIIPKDFNDMNREEPSRYFDIEKCHLLVELDVPRVTYREPRYVMQDVWEPVVKETFVDATRSHGFFRAFFFPYASWKTCAQVDYVVLLNRNHTRTN